MTDGEIEEFLVGQVVGRVGCHHDGLTYVVPVIFAWEAGCAYAIRADDIEITSSGIPAIILSAREHGPDLRLECAAPHKLIIFVKSGDRADMRPGSTIHLTLPQSRLKRLERV